MFRISKVAVLGSGVMGSTIACHLANVGHDVLMLDIVTPGLSEEETHKPAARNRLVDTALKTAIKSKPAPLYYEDFARRIRTGNFEDDMAQISDCDWIIEVVIERLDIKQQIFAQVEEHRKAGSLISSNTSGIPIHLMTADHSDDFKKHFLGTHFFNPPRYLELFEIIPIADTHQDVIDFFMHYGHRILGKQTVLAKDTPAFIANRVGVYSMAHIYHLALKYDLTIEDVDKLTGPALGRPKTGTFRLSDLVGLDVADKVIKGIQKGCPEDESVQSLKNPAFFNYLLENKFNGNKSGQGFYKKTKERDENGRPIILGLDLKESTYRPKQKSALASLTLSKQIERDAKRIQSLYAHADAGGRFIHEHLVGLFAYVSNRIPEISDTLYNLDKALRAGFAWSYGPFEYWDMIGVEQGIRDAEALGYSVAPWVKEMIADGNTRFYKKENGATLYFDQTEKKYNSIPGSSNITHLDQYRHKEPVFKNDEITLHDIGDQVLCIEFTSKMNAIGEGILRGINESIEIAESGDWRGIVIGNHAQNFTVGANLMMIAMMAYQQQWMELNMAVDLFQKTTMRCRYSSIPVVAATQGYTFGGGCETIMHCDAVVAAAESYIGLVEVGVGLIPGGSGTKEMAVRASDAFFAGDVQIPTLIERFKTIAMASVATSAYEAFDHAYLLSEKDEVIVNKHLNLTKAKQRVIELSDGYVTPVERKDIMVLGRTGLGALYTAAHSLKLGKYASDHDIKIANKIAWVLCGGDLSEPTRVSEQYLIDLEREAFLSLCGEQKTLERIQHMLEKNKPLRN